MIELQHFLQNSSALSFALVIIIMWFASFSTDISDYIDPVAAEIVRAYVQCVYYTMHTTTYPNPVRTPRITLKSRAGFVNPALEREVKYREEHIT